ncbi:MAG: condensation domain-containing protein, partial [Chloroflexota bacterium]|nr:condensation domain-containing protein [Chloroflexota bacterium]
MADQHRQPTESALGVAPTEDRAARRERLDRYLAERDASPLRGTDGGIPRGPRTTEHPLSLGQEQIWLHSQLSSDPSAYNEPLTLTHRGPLDVEVLRRTLAEVIRRHEAWRTTFREVDGQPVAVVHDPPDVDLPAVDLRHLAPSEREAEAVRLATDDARWPFDLKAGPILRFLLVTMSEDEQRLYLALHQIVFDGVSMYSGFLPEVAAIYNDLAAGREVSLPEPPAQYQDFVRWQRATATGTTLEAQLAYWRAQLGEVRSLDLPTDRPRPAVQSYDGEQVSFSLPEDLSRELRAFSRREGVTLFTTLLTAFATLLVRRTADEVPTIGSVTSLRKRTELQRLLGFYLNTLALRVDLTGDPSFREALRRTRKVVVDGLSHDDVPIHQVVHALALPRDPSRSPLFQTMLVLEPPLPDPPTGWELSQLDIDVGRSRADLYLEFDDRPGALIGRVRYATALFQRATVDGILAQLLILLWAAIAAPDRPIGALPVLSDADREAWLAAGNRVAPTTPFEPFIANEIEQSIAARFAREVAAFGDRPAVIEADRAWTYGELNAAADGVAVAIETVCPAGRPRVGLLGQQGAPLVAAILGILKAGGAYVPVDPQFPAMRIRSIALDAELDLIVVGEGLDGLVRDALADAVPIVGMAVATAGRP